MSRIRQHLSTIVVAMITAAVTAAAPAIAHGVKHALFAHNSDKVDGLHAVKANAANKNKKLVATGKTGLLPPTIIPAVDAATVDGKDASDFADAIHQHDSSYINQDPGAPENAFISISGTLGTTGLLRTGSRTGTADAPGASHDNVVIRPLNSVSNTAGNVAARTEYFRLERDGTADGLRIAWNADSPPVSLGFGPQSASCLGVSDTGASIASSVSIGGADPGTAQLIQSTVDWVYLECFFGTTEGGGLRHSTKVTLSRPNGTSSSFAGFLISTFNQ